MRFLMRWLVLLLHGSVVVVATLRGTSSVRIAGGPVLSSLKDCVAIQSFLSSLGSPTRVEASRAELRHPRGVDGGWTEGLPSVLAGKSQWKDRRFTVFGAEEVLRVWWGNEASMQVVIFEDVEGGRTVTSFLPLRRFGAFSSSDDDSSLQRFVVCSYNVWNWNHPYELRVSRILALLERESCDLTLFQEMRYRWAASQTVSRWMIKDLVKPNTTSAWHWSRAMTYIGEGGFHHDEGLAFTLAQGSGFYVVDIESFPLSRNPNDEQDEHQRILLRAQLSDAAGKRSLNVFVTHMSLSARARARNAVEILRIMQRYSGGGPQIFAGDLNGTPDDHMYKFFTGALTMEGITGDLIDVWANLGGGGGGDGFTFPAWKPEKRIDFLMMRSSAESSLVANSIRLFGAASTQSAAASDHLGLRGEFLFGSIA